jgi:short-chain fatty acids transporter
MEKTIGIVPISKTIFHPLNILLLVVLIPLCCFVAWWIHPSKKETVTIDPNTLDKMKEFTPSVLPENPTTGQRIDHLSLWNHVAGAAGLIWLGWYLFTKGFMLINLNVVIFAFLMIGMILHKTPAALEKAAFEGTESAWGVILQFPFYAGIFGIVMESGLANVVAGWFISISTPRSFPPIVYIYSCIINYFVPSGGAKWALEAPYIVAAAKGLGVSMTNTIIPYAYGDMTTNLLQPFWALPLLALTNLKLKDIIGFNIIFALTTFAVILILLFILPGLL